MYSCCQSVGEYTAVTDVVSLGAGGRISLMTERSLVDGSVRTLKEGFSSLLVEVNKVDIL